MRAGVQNTQGLQSGESGGDAGLRNDLTHPSLTFELTPVGPFRLDFTAWALRRRPQNQIDRWDGSTYRRVISIQGRPAEVHVSQEGSAEKPRLHVNVTGPRVGPRAKNEVDMLLTRMFGLQVDLKPFYRIASRDSKRCELAEKYRGLKPVRFPTIFETLANAISCQQFTIAAGLQLLNRLGRLGNLVLETEAGVMFGSPDPSDLLRLSSRTFRRLGFSRHKTLAFRELSRDILVNRLDLELLANLNNEDAINFLLRLRGVGRWTAEYGLLRGLGRLDVFPGDDVGARNGLAKRAARPPWLATIRWVCIFSHTDGVFGRSRSIACCKSCRSVSLVEVLPGHCRILASSCLSQPVQFLREPTAPFSVRMRSWRDTEDPETR